MKYRIVEKNGTFTVEKKTLFFWHEFEMSGLNINANTLYSEGITRTFSKEDAVTLLSEYIKTNTKIIHEVA